MIISVDPTNTEDIATFALVKQYRLVPLSTTLAMTAWTADATNGGYTLTQNVSDTGILVYTDPSVVVAFNASVEDTTSAPAGQDANVIATEIQADATNTCYIVTFHADTIPVANVVVNLLIYGTTIPGQSSGEDPATAEEITAAVLQNLDGRVTALEEEMPDKADKATTLAGYGITDAYTKTEADTLLGAKADQATTYTKSEVNTALALKADKSDTYTKAQVDTYLAAKADDDAVVHKAGAETIPGVKTFTADVYLSKTNTSRYRCWATGISRGVLPSGTVSAGGFIAQNNNGDVLMGVTHTLYSTGEGISSWFVRDYNGANLNELILHSDGYVTAPSRGYHAGATYSNDVATIGTLDAYTPMVRTTGNQTITGGTKLFTGQCQLLEHGKLYRAGSAGMEINTFYELFNAPFPNGDARAVIEIITLKGYGVIGVTQIGTNTATAEDKVGNLLSNGQIEVDMVVSNGRRILYIKKTIAGDLIASVKNFNIAGVWQGVPITDGYVPRS